MKTRSGAEARPFAGGGACSSSAQMSQSEEICRAHHSNSRWAGRRQEGWLNLQPSFISKDSSSHGEAVTVSQPQLQIRSRIAWQLWPGGLAAALQGKGPRTLPTLPPFGPQEVL